MAKRGTLKYRKITRTPQSGENANKKMWYATTVTDREVSFEDFVPHVSEHNSPYSRGTVHGVLMDTLDCLQELILDGKSVRFADLGLFSIGMTSKGVESKDKVSAASVEGVHLILRNTKSWSNTELRKKCRIEEYNAYGNTEDTGNTNGDDPNQGGDSNQGDCKAEVLTQEPREAVLRAVLREAEATHPVATLKEAEVTTDPMN